MNRTCPMPQIVCSGAGIVDDGVFPLRETVRRALCDESTLNVAAISYRSDLAALEGLGLVSPREHTRLIFVPPDGIPRPDVERLLAMAGPGLELKQVDRSRVGELIHYKLILFSRADGGHFAVVGSANHTGPGTSPCDSANAELSTLIRLHSGAHDELTHVFDHLWSHGSTDLRPECFVTQAHDAEDQRGLHPAPILLAFQQDALDDLCRGYMKRRGTPGRLLSLPTGGGKTMIAVRFLLECVLTAPGRRVLWLAPHRELLYQAASTFEACARYNRTELTIPSEQDLETNADSQWSEQYDVDFHTTAGYENARQKAYDVVVVDEAHYGATMECARLPEIRRRFASAYFLGLTATPFRKNVSEMTDLNKLFGEPLIVDQSTVEAARDARQRKVLAEVVHVPVHTGYNITLEDEYLEALELRDQALKAFNDAKERNPKVIRLWSKEKHGRTLIFAVSVDHANALAEEFAKRHPAASVQVLHTGEVPSRLKVAVKPRDGHRFSREERRIIQKRFNRDVGGIDCLISVDLYTMGVDFPAVRTLFMARPTLSPVRYIQMLGRGLRGPAFGGTDSVIVVDFCDQVEALAKLADRMVDYQKARNWEERLEAQYREIRDLWRQVEKPGTPARVRDESLGRGGVYRVTTKGGSQVRRWRWVADIGGALRSGMENERINAGHLVEFIPVDKEDEGKNNAWLLRFADNIGFKRADADR